MYKYNPYGCLTSIKHKKSLDSICYTRKAPLLIFSGDSEDIFKWEQTQSNQLIYSSERLIKTENVTKVSSNYQGESKKLMNLQSDSESNANEEFFSRGNSGKTILKLIFYEKLDLIFAGCEDSNVYVWGFDEDAVKILKKMNSEMQNGDKRNSENSNQNNYEGFESLQNEENSDDTNNSYLSQNVAKKKLGDDSVTNRVAGFKLKKIFAEHTSSVTAMTIVENKEFKKSFLLSTGWDRYRVISLAVKS